MKVLYGTPSDIESWMNLVKEVSPIFPGLETAELIEEFGYPNQKFVLRPLL